MTAAAVGADAGAGAAVGGPYGALIGAGVGLVSSAMSNDANEDIANSTNSANDALAGVTRQFEYDMDSTKYQRTVADLSKAGLNPMLAYTNGPSAGAPPVPTPQHVAPQFRSPLEGALSGYQAVTQNDLTKAQVGVAQSQQAVNTASAANQNAQAQKTEAETPGARTTSTYAPQLQGAQIDKLQFEAGLTKATTDAISAKLDAGEPKAAVDLLRAEASNAKSGAARNAIETTLGKLQVPGAQAQAKYDQLMGVARPALKDVGQVVHSAAEGYGAFKSGQLKDYIRTGK